MMRMDSDLLALLLATTNATLTRQACRWVDDAAVCVVMASRTVIPKRMSVISRSPASSMQPGCLESPCFMPEPPAGMGDW